MSPKRHASPAMPGYVTLKETRKEFGRNNYLEASRQKLKEEGAASPAEYILVARGYFDKDGVKRWSRFVTLPDDPEMVKWLAKSIQEM